MLGRALSFAQPDILDAVRTWFVPVALDDWYARREKTPDGEFFRRIADQGPKPAADFHTRQGLYVATPGGRLLAYKNSGEFPDLTRQLLADGLARWDEVKHEGESGTATTLTDDPRYPRTPPAGGLVLGVRQRRLTRTPTGYGPGVPDKPGGELVMRQTVWFRPHELAWLVPPPGGRVVDVPDPVPARLARFYTQDVTQGDGEFWPRSAVRETTLTARTVRLVGVEQHIRYDGRFRLEYPTLGRCDARLRGEAVFDRAAGRFTRVEWVVVCEVVRPDGRAVTHAGLFRLPDPNDVADRLPPDGVKSPAAYWRNAP